MKWLLNIKIELLCIMGAVVSFFLVNLISSVVMPTEGTNSPFYLTLPVLALFYAFSVGAIGWVLFAVLFPTGDRYIDSGSFKMDFSGLDPKWKIVATLIGVILCMFVSLACLLIAALP